MATVINQSTFVAGPSTNPSSGDPIDDNDDDEVGVWWELWY